MKAISIRQPWAWYILHAGKDIENRCWRTRFRGRVLIHAAKGMTRAEYALADDPLFVAARDPVIHPPAFAELQRGGIVGSVEIVDCVDQSDSAWFNGPFGFVLRDARVLPFIPCRGSLGFFDIPQGVVAQLPAYAAHGPAPIAVHA